MRRDDTTLHAMPAPLEAGQEDGPAVVTEEQRGIGDNGGPPLDEPHRPPWGEGPIGTYFGWCAAHRASHRPPSAEVALRRLSRAEALGLTYHEYARELAERGRHLQPGDTERIAAIKAARAIPTR